MKSRIFNLILFPVMMSVFGLMFFKEYFQIESGFTTGIYGVFNAYKLIIIIITLLIIFFVFINLKKIENEKLRAFIRLQLLLITFYLPFEIISSLSHIQTYPIIKSREYFNYIFNIVLALYYLAYNASILYYGFNYYIKLNWINSKNREFSIDNDIWEKYHLTNREKEVLLFIVKGFTNKEIAYDLKVSAFTVKNHIHNIYQKIGLKTKVELINMVYNRK